ncbi:MAG: serine/threonine protein kinase [Acidobacteria bacterium]|nr:serine/threonine protein kinase [Acidobacteriota bacterium]
MSELPPALAALVESLADGSVDPTVRARASEAGVAPGLLAAFDAVSALAEVHRAIDEGPLGATTPEVEESAQDPPSGKGPQWGNFRLLLRLGAGTFGEVYLAHNLWLDQAVALKLLRPEHSHAASLKEAQQLARVRHPNVVVVHGADRHDGRLGFWMDHVDGTTLSDVLDTQGLMRDSEAALTGVELCGALAAVHAAGIVHRDIKAQNVMRRRQDGRLLLMDFGAGEYLNAPREPGNRAAGTPLYLAPEVLHGERATVASDLYALGVLLFHLLSGRFPVEADSLDDLRGAHAAGRRLGLEELQPTANPLLIRVIETMLDPDPAKRYRSAVAAKAALLAAIAEQPARPAVFPWGVPVVGVLLTGAFVLALGGVSTSAFNLVLGRTGDFARESVQSMFVLGCRALVAPLVYMGLAGAAAGVGISAVRLASRLLARFVPRAWRPTRLTALLLGLEPVFLLDLLAAIGVLAVAGLVGLSWERLSALTASISTSPLEQVQTIPKAYDTEFFLQARSLEVFVLLYGFAAYGVFSRVGAAATRVPWRTGLAVAAVPVLAFLLLRGIPYRVLYQNQAERVDHAAERCYRIGERQDAVLLYCPDAQPPRNRVVAKGDPDLRPRGVIESIFAPPGPETP